MNQYLLLRDNKQSGPYAMEALVAMGLKPYDLVWVEGKSAAWRYPSEIAELKPYAPVVEEQPYDRFYKKPALETHPQLEQQQNTTQSGYTTPAAQTTQPAHNPHPKNIYVTLPADSGHTTGAVAQQPATNVTPYSKKAGSLPDDPAPVTAEMKKEQLVKTAPVLPVNEFPYEAPEPEPVRQTVPMYEQQLPKRSKSVRLVMSGLVAACLLLSGVIIGLAISNYRQQSQNDALEELVRNIQQREKNKQLLPPPGAVQPASGIREQDQSATELHPPVDQEPTGKPEVPVTVVSKKERVTPVNKESNLASVPVSPARDGVMQTNPAVMEPNAEKITYQQAIEAARKNIHQMLLLESSKYKTGLLGGISNLQLTLNNTSRYPLDQVEIEIRYYGPENKLIKTQTLLFNDLAPGEQKTLEAPRTSRGVSIDYAITRINSKVLGLARADFHN